MNSYYQAKTQPICSSCSPSDNDNSCKHQNACSFECVNYKTHYNECIYCLFDMPTINHDDEFQWNCDWNPWDEIVSTGKELIIYGILDFLKNGIEYKSDNYDNVVYKFYMKGVSIAKAFTTNLDRNTIIEQIKLL